MQANFPRWVLTGGLGGMGGAQPLAATMDGLCMLAVEVSQERIDARLRTKYLDVQAASLDEALAAITEACRQVRQPLDAGIHRTGQRCFRWPLRQRRGCI